MKKIIKTFVILFVSFVFLSGVKAYTYDNMTVTIDGISSGSNPLQAAYLKIEGATPNSEDYLVLANGSSLLTDELTSKIPSDYNNNVQFSYLYGNSLAKPDTGLNAYNKLAQYTDDVYAALYRVNSNTHNYDKISNTTKIDKENIPLGSRIKVFVLDKINISIHSYDDIDTTKTIKYKIGKVTDNTLLNKLKQGTGLNLLLTVAKDDSNPISTGSMTCTDISDCKVTNNLSLNDFTDKKYYYVYAYRDTNNGKFVELEDVMLYQHMRGNNPSYVFLADMSDSIFTWEIDDTPTPTPTTHKLSFEKSSYICAKDDVIETYAISDLEVTYSTTNNEIATIDLNPTGTKCSSVSDTDCKEIKITCVAVGAATIKAATSDNTISSPIEVLESLDPVTITYNTDKGSACSSKTIYKGQKIGTLCSTTKKGYTFEGWYTEGGTKVSSNTVLNGNITLIAKWKAVVNPNTGVMVPVLGIVVLTCVSAITFIVLTKKSRMFN